MRIMMLKRFLPLVVITGLMHLHAMDDYIKHVWKFANEQQRNYLNTLNALPEDQKNVMMQQLAQKFPSLFATPSSANSSRIIVKRGKKITNAQQQTGYPIRSTPQH